MESIVLEKLELLVTDETDLWFCCVATCHITVVINYNH